MSILVRLFMLEGLNKVVSQQPVLLCDAYDLQAPHYCFKECIRVCVKG